MDNTTIKIFDFEKICRLCMNEKKFLIEIFESSPDNNNLTIDQKIKSCTAINLYKGDGLPSRICIRCLSCINAAIEFKNQCENSEKTLRNIHNLCVTNDTKKENKRDFENITSEINENKDIKKVVLNYDRILIIRNQESENLETQSQNSFKTISEEEEKSFKDNLICLSEKELELENYLENAEKIKNNDAAFKKTALEFLSDDQKAYKVVVTPRDDREGIGVTNSKPKEKQKGREDSLKSPCPFCNKKLTRVDEHVRLFHRNRVYVCTKRNCGAEFLTLKNLQSHQLRCFDVEKAYKCPKCSKDFHRKSNFKAHFRRHADQKDFQCQLCERAFVDSTGLKRHYLRHHEPEQEVFISGCCGKRFKSKEGLKKHIRNGICGFQVFQKKSCEDAIAKANKSSMSL